MSLRDTKISTLALWLISISCLLTISSTGLLTYYGAQAYVRSQVSNDSVALAQSILNEAVTRSDEIVLEATKNASLVSPEDISTNPTITLDEEVISDAYFTERTSTEAGIVYKEIEKVVSNGSITLLQPFCSPLPAPTEKVTLCAKLNLAKLAPDILPSNTKTNAPELLLTRDISLVSTAGKILFSTKRYPLFADFETRPFATIAGEYQAGKSQGIYQLSSEKIIAYSYQQNLELPNQHWLIIIEHNMSGVIQTISQLVIANTIVSLLVSLLLILISSSIVKKNILGPGRELVHAMHRVETGNFDIHLHPQGGSEIGNATRIFLRLVKSYQEIITRLTTATTELRLLSKILRHDVSNRLVLITYSLQQLQANPRLEQSLSEELAGVVRVTEATLSYIQDSQKIADQKTGSLSEFNLRRIAEEVTNLEPGVDIRISGEAVVPADSAVFSLFGSIVHNAVVHGGVKRVDISIEKNSRSTVTVRISDQGKGISEAVKKRLFHEGFIDTKKGHTGTGLSSAQQIMQRYKGKIWIEDNKPKGTTFVLEFRAKR